MSTEEHYSEAYLLGLHGDMPERPVRARPCGDCAVVCGMYRPISDDLARCSRETQRIVSARWFCHATPGFGCRGNVNNLSARVKGRG